MKERPIAPELERSDRLDVFSAWKVCFQNGMYLSRALENEKECSMLHGSMQMCESILAVIVPRKKVVVIGRICKTASH